jgi:ankyrin repeat protein
MISCFEIAADDTDAGQVHFRRLLEQPDILQRWTPLQWAAFVDRKDEFNTLIENGADPFRITPSGRNVLHHAAESGTSDVLEYLLLNKYHEKGININLHDIWGDTPLHVAAAKTPALVALLLQHGAALDEAQGEGLVPLHQTSLLKGPERLKSVDLFSNHVGCPINARDENGWTPIMHLLNSVSCVELLLDRGADVSLCDNNGRSIMHHACIEDQPQIIVMLLKKCPEKAQELATHSDTEGDTPLFTSFQRYRPQCARLLLTRAPISMVTDKKGWSLLHHAVKMGNVEVLKLALSVPDVGIFARTNDGETVFSIARDRNYMDGPIGETLRCAARLDEETFQQLNRRPLSMWEIHSMIR